MPKLVSSSTMNRYQTPGHQVDVQCGVEANESYDEGRNDIMRSGPGNTVRIML
jgi:hypothetical protein